MFPANRRRVAVTSERVASGSNELVVSSERVTKSFERVNLFTERMTKSFEGMQIIWNGLQTAGGELQKV